MSALIALRNISGCNPASVRSIGETMPMPPTGNLSKSSAPLADSGMLLVTLIRPIVFGSSNRMRAYMATLSDEKTAEAIARIRAKRNADAAAVEREIDAAASVRRHGYCAAAWQPGVFVVATPLILASGPIYALNLSLASDMPVSTLVSELSDPLLELRRNLSNALERRAV